MRCPYCPQNYSSEQNALLASRISDKNISCWIQSCPLYWRSQRESYWTGGKLTSIGKITKHTEFSIFSHMGDGKAWIDGNGSKLMWEYFWILPQLILRFRTELGKSWQPPPPHTPIPTSPIPQDREYYPPPLHIQKKMWTCTPPLTYTPISGPGPRYWGIGWRVGCKSTFSGAYGGMG